MSRVSLTVLALKKLKTGVPRCGGLSQILSRASGLSTLRLRQLGPVLWPLCWVDGSGRECGSIPVMYQVVTRVILLRPCCIYHLLGIVFLFPKEQTEAGSLSNLPKVRGRTLFWVFSCLKVLLFLTHRLLFSLRTAFATPRASCHYRGLKAHN